jgi:hypothetical protein
MRWQRFFWNKQRWFPVTVELSLATPEMTRGGLFDYLIRSQCPNLVPFNY